MSNTNMKKRGLAEKFWSWHASEWNGISFACCWLKHCEISHKAIGITKLLLTLQLLVSKFNTGLKLLLKQGLSDNDLVYKFRKNVGRNDVSDQFRKIINRYKRTRYNMHVMWQTACLVVNTITVNNFAALFNCTPVGRALDLMMTLA